MKNKNTIYKNIYALVCSIEFYDGSRQYDVTQEYFEKKIAAINMIKEMKIETPPGCINKYFNFKIIKYQRILVNKNE